MMLSPGIRPISLPRREVIKAWKKVPKKSHHKQLYMLIIHPNLIHFISLKETELLSIDILLHGVKNTQQCNHINHFLNDVKTSSLI